MGFQPQRFLVHHLTRNHHHLKRPLALTTAIRHLSSSLDNNKSAAESHLLPRLYIGPTQKSALSLQEFLVQQGDKSHQHHHLQSGGILQLSPGQINYVTNVMRMVGPGRKTKGRWTFQDHDPCVRVFSETEEWVARLEAMDDLGGGDDSSGNNSGKKRRRKNKNIDSMTVLAHCIEPLKTTTTKDADDVLIPLLCFAPPKKKDRFQWILEKSTELGMAGWMLLQTDRTEASSSRDYWGKGQAYVLEAAEQCERLSIPPVVMYTEEDTTNIMKNSHAEDSPSWDTETTLSQLSSMLQYMVAMPTTNVSVLICRERSPNSTPIRKALEQIMDDSSNNDDNKRRHCCVILIGPEGGWSPEEEAMFDKVCQEQMHVRNVSLGKNVLRTDTAAVTAMAAFSLYND